MLPVTEEEFLFHIKARMRAPVIRAYRTDWKACKKVSRLRRNYGRRFPAETGHLTAGADIFITADYKYLVEFLMPRENLTVIADIGHFEKRTIYTT